MQKGDAHVLKKHCVPQEFADNLRGKGIHGALMALDPSFDTDALGKALGIPSNKHMLHQHLYEELKSLAIPHRYDCSGQPSSSLFPEVTSPAAHQYLKHLPYSYLSSK